MDYICLDIETTGTNSSTDKIVQFAAIKYVGGKETESINTFINPGMPMSAGAAEVTGITDDMLKDKPSFREVAQGILEFIGPKPVIMAYNAFGLDIPMLAAEFERVGLEFPSIEDITVIDPMVIYSEMYKRTLSATYKFYTGKDPVDAHDALADVRMTAELFAAQLDHHDLDEDDDYSQIVSMSTRGRSFVDYAGKIARNDQGIPCWTFGKLVGQPVKSDAGFAQWVLNNNFPTSTKKAVRKIFAE